MGVANGQILSMRRHNFSKTLKQKNMTKRCISLWCQWVLLGLASVKQTSTLLIMQMHRSHLLLCCLFKDATLDLFYIEFEQQRELREKGFRAITNQSVHDEPAGEVSSSAETANDQIVEVNARVRFKSDSAELPSLEEEGELNEDYMDSAVGIDGSSHTSESLYAEKHDISSIHEVDSLRSAISVELGGSSLSQSPRPDNGDQCDPRLAAQGSSDWVHGWSSDYSVDNDLATAYEENSRLRGSLEVAESSISDLKLEVSSLQSQADVLGTETQRFAQELAADIALGEELSREVSILKSDCTKLKGDIEKLKHSKARQHFHSTETELLSKEVCWTKCDLLEGSSFDSKIGANDIGKYQDCLAHDVQMRLRQGLSLMEDTVRAIQNKACQDQGMDLAFLQPDLEALESVVQGLKEGIWQVTPLQNIRTGERTSVKAVGVMGVNSEQAVWGDGPKGCDAECFPSKGTVNSVGTSLQVLQELDPLKNDLEAADVTNKKFSELSSELEQSKAERENLMRKIDQMECYYEAVIQELKECQKQMLDELQNLRHEHSACIYTVSDLKSQINGMHQDINEQLQRSAEDRCNLDDLNRELEKRAIASETTLKRACWNYSIAVGQLQKDLELLSFQVVSLFETNEKLAQQAFTEVSQLGFREYIEEPSDDVHSCLQKDDSESALLKAHHEAKLHEVQADTVISGETKPKLPPKQNVPSVELSERPKKLLNEDILCEEVKRSLHLQEELHQEAEQEISEMHELNLRLEVFSKVLQESLREANVGIRLIKKERDEFAQQLEHSAEVELLMLKLQAALDEVETLRESEAKCIIKCDDLALKNHTLEVKLKSISDENCLLTQNVTECDILFDECASYRSKHEACSAEKNGLENALKQESLEKSHLQRENISLVEELKALQAEFDKQLSVKDSLEKTVAFMQDRLGDLRSRMVSYNEQTNGPTLFSKSMQQESEDENFMTIFLHLEELQQSAYIKILQLSEEKQELKQKFESDLRDMATKLDMANTHAEKLRIELQDVEDKLTIRSEVAEKYAEQNRELSSKLDVLETKLQHVTSENKDLAQKILTLDCVNRELEKTKLSVMDCMQENKALMISLQAGNEASLQLEKEISGLKESLRCAHDELQSDRGLRGESEATVRDLTSQLNVKHEQVLSFDDQKAALVHLRQQLLDLELEKSRVRNLLLHSEECQRKVDEDDSSLRLKVMDLETYLETMHAYLLAAEVEVVFTENQFWSRVQELLERLSSLERCNEDLLLKHLDVVTKLNGHMAGEAQCIEENAKLMMALQSLKSELETNVSEKRELADYVDKRSSMWAELENCKTMAVVVEAEASQEKHRQIEQLKSMLMSSEEEMDNLQSCRDELEITVIVLRSKLDEQAAQLSLLQEYEDELMKLRHEEKLQIELQDGGKDAANIVAADDVNKVDRLTFSDSANMLSSFREAKDASLVSTDEMKSHSLELGRMKNEYVASLLPEDEHHSAPGFHGLQGELLQLHMANERLGSIFPLFNKFSGSGNALERVLALEIELAEALQAKKNSSIHFQSSFLKQHNDEEAIFKSFRDINDLIKDTLEVKSRYAAVETELKDMQERYSQLSLQFAEVEGERQELVMALKNVRPPRKP
ncbi:uncharacterized protein LOC131232568 isoform X2 [Magnolia sinica]|uniref:uncharacterized protein LOC131232568 isoform X2 n=1 Tax=Magnolia sinica TaxID=86752 RepID=UPI002658C8C4|nr:uncharacterized protein LOC131232568 isoform X2 [Magnolia sinica]XP_058084893.1 uncharacterized protein LOC131232568 isoform X2 [Magnolia sinica]